MCPQDSYLTSLIERDVKELAAIERQGDLRRLLALLAGRQAAFSSQRRSQESPAFRGPR
jgi:predicted AAA+ superfamily ATPase